MTAAIAADPFPGRAVVLYDGQCPLCQRSVAILKKLDWLGRLAFQNGRDTEHLPPSAVPLVPQRLIEEMHLVTPDRQRVVAGFGAFRWMAWRLPLTLPLAPLAYLPGVPWFGNRIYRWVAKNRLNLVPCHDGGCRVPLKRN
ncbi:MAG: thiol-disulfide oxidoreductase DCC family protein [Fimbriiglobus sp.]